MTVLIGSFEYVQKGDNEEGEATIQLNLICGSLVCLVPVAAVGSFGETSLFCLLGRCI